MEKDDDTDTNDVINLEFETQQRQQIVVSDNSPEVQLVQEQPCIKSPVNTQHPEYISLQEHPLQQPVQVRYQDIQCVTLLTAENEPDRLVNPIQIYPSDNETEVNSAVNMNVEPVLQEEIILPIWVQIEDSPVIKKTSETLEKNNLDLDEKEIVDDDDEKDMEIDAAESIQVQTEGVEVEEIETVNRFWPYELPEGLMKVLKPVALTPESEFSPFGKNKKKTNFLKGCKWAPDGSCLISNSDDDILRLFNVPESLYTIQDWKNYDDSINVSPCDITSALKVKEGGQVYDYCWYPLMSSYDPVSSCFLTTCADSPVHLWDAFTGTLRASYLAYNHVDEVTAARCIAFDPTGENIFCGFDTTLRTFNITRPGRECTVRKLKHLQISELNQPGIISCIAVNPTLRTVQALGSYLKTVGMYCDDGSVLCILEGHLGGVTHLKFSHDGNKLFSGGRKDSRLICWDMRFMGEEYKIYDRVVATNQRVYFDITPNDKYLITGGTDGIVKLWDIMNESADPLTFRANTDCVNGVSINPFIPLLATSSGQRHFNEIVANSLSDSDSDDSMLSDLSSKMTEERDIKLWKLC